MELSADGPVGPQTAGLVIQSFQTVAEDVFIWSVGPSVYSVNPPRIKLGFRNPLSCILTYLFTNYCFGDKGRSS